LGRASSTSHSYQKTGRARLSPGLDIKWLFGEIPKRIERGGPGCSGVRFNQTRRGMSKEAMRAEAERLVREAMERKNLTVKQGKTRIETKCGKCGAPNRVSADVGETRVAYTCKECGSKQKTL
jgi:hypothetical protein